jgi:DNA-binding PadR family transcriptional regulator
MFDGGELRLVILSLIAEKPRHGYEVIKALGERAGGDYSPSPGVVYPTLTLLEESGLASASADEGFSTRTRRRATRCSRGWTAKTAPAGARRLRCCAR